MKIPPQSRNIRIKQRKYDCAVFFDTDATWGGNDCFRSFSNITLAQMFAAGIDVQPTLKKGRRVKISEKSKNPSQDEMWTERKTGEEVLQNTMTVFHFGFNGSALFPKITCFYRAWPRNKAEVPAGALIAEIHAGSKVEYFDDDEVRVDLSTESVTIWKIAS